MEQAIVRNNGTAARGRGTAERPARRDLLAGGRVVRSLGRTEQSRRGIQRSRKGARELSRGLRLPANEAACKGATSAVWAPGGVSRKAEEAAAGTGEAGQRRVEA
ncbi:uncharacterized protein A4U43_C08F10090 [Asparagus officinalis]|nr:uncharacterized protein A4U43_C08F10090 [Asparagus officinalis]